MSEEREVLKLALEALKKSRDRIVEQGGSGWKLHAQQCVNAITAIREALAEQPAQQQEPVAEYIGECNDGSLVQLYDDVKKGAKFYTSPPESKPWVGLTDEEVINVMPDDDTPISLGEAFSKFADLIEAKLREKNNG